MTHVHCTRRDRERKRQSPPPPPRRRLGDPAAPPHRSNSDLTADEKALRIAAIRDRLSAPLFQARMGALHAQEGRP
jgi:hypothetical protein